MPFLLLSGVLWNDMRFTAKVVEGYNAIAGASKLLLVDLSLPCLVVELLHLWSRKELHPAHGNCTYDEDISLQKSW